MGEFTPQVHGVNANLTRRHLNETQRAVVASRIANMPKYLHKNDMQICISQPEAADMLNVSPRIVASVKAIEREAPDLLEKLETGKLTVHRWYISHFSHHLYGHPVTLHPPPGSSQEAPGEAILQDRSKISL